MDWGKTMGVINKNYIDDLTNFNGSLDELKQIVDYLHDSYGWDSNIMVELEYDCINFAIIQETLH